MSFELLKKVGDAQKKKAVVDVRSGDTVRVSQKIKEGSKFRTQVFEGTVIRADRKDSHTARITVRKVASGVGVEKSFLLHNPLVEKVEIVRRSKVRRNNLSYLRDRSGKSARLVSKDFDRHAVNDLSAAETVTAPTTAETDTAPKTNAADTASATDTAPTATTEQLKEVLAAEKANAETIEEKRNPKGSGEPEE